MVSLIIKWKKGVGVDKEKGCQRGIKLTRDKLTRDKA